MAATAVVSVDRASVDLATLRTWRGCTIPATGWVFRMGMGIVLRLADSAVADTARKITAVITRAAPMPEGVRLLITQVVTGRWKPIVV